VEALTAMAFFMMTPFCSCQFTGQEHASLFLIGNEGNTEFRRNRIQNVADFWFPGERALWRANYVL
jgi:hypothetical protein